ncbi:MAG: alpha-amylase family glycosyl hydrolase [Draconibacterium sp.]
MFPKSFIIIFLLALAFSVNAQITTSPELPLADQKVTITFDSSKEDRLGYYTDDLYAHTGLITKSSASDTDWKYVIENWGNNTTQPKLTNKGNGIYELEISPDIYTFYDVPAEEKILKLAFVFRSSDSKKQSDNLYVDVSSLTVKITEPSNKSFFNLNESANISATATKDAALKLFINDEVIAQENGTAISANYLFNQGGQTWIIAEAADDTEIERDSVLVFVSDGIVTVPKPKEYRKGINYISDNSVALVLWAPLKDSVSVIGDFNDWKATKEYKMNKDGFYFWLEISNLEKGKEYAFQYFIDGEIKIADPYAEKILNPWDDKYISSSVYPDLMPYPGSITSGIVSVLQPGQDEFNWEVPDFQIPDKSKLVIYELLVRDFKEEHTFKAVREKLDYLENLRINVLELMPVNEFEGNSSWGYNPAFYFAPDKYYGPKNELKKLIDECHKRGIAVVIDMVLNHSYGQSPFVQMYMNNWIILPENPWYNVTSPNSAYSWGYDFNHEADVVKELVDSVNSFWMNEYKVDGFRFDFTKGFTNTPGDGWAYDASRIQILERMANEIWARKNDALVILEHLSENKEETELANHGILLWGNMHGSYEQAATGNTGSSDLSWAIYSERGWNEPNLVSYPESHDEERIMYTIKQSGLSSGDYNIKNLNTALDRIELNSLFHLPLPGPKMIWQFGERGYDVSINDFGGRLGEKPPYWNYLDDSNRTDVYKVMAKLNELKQTYEEFTPDDFDYNLTGSVKWYRLSNGNNHVVALGNFDITQKNVTVTFPASGKWYRYFSRDSVEFDAPQQTFTLAPGEYRLYSTRKFIDPDISTDARDIKIQSENILLYPNPAQTEINITSSNVMSEIRIFSASGRVIYQSGFVNMMDKKVNVDSWEAGVYIVQVVQNNKTSSLKFLKH